MTAGSTLGTGESANDREPTEREKFVFMAALYHLTDGDTEVSVPTECIYAEVRRIEGWTDAALRQYGRAAVARRHAREKGQRQ